MAYSTSSGALQFTWSHSGRMLSPLMYAFISASSVGFGSRRPSSSWITK